MKSIQFLLLCAVGVACEGEPPKTAESANAAPEVLATASAEEAETAQAPTAPAPTCCQCQCAGQDAGAPIALAGDGGAIANASDAADISGDVTTTPAYLRGASVVYLTDAPLVPDRGMRARVSNHNMGFAPLLQVIAAGGSISFLNDDPFPHNVFSPDHGRFDLGLVQPGHAITHKFEKAGAYTLLCNLHPNMLGWIVVAPSSYFAKTDARGHFVIKDVPLGKYTIEAWAPRLQTASQPIEVTGKPTKVEFELHR